MNFSQLVARLRENSVSVTVEGDAIRVRAPEGAVDDQMRAALEEHADRFRRLEAGGRSSGSSYAPRERVDRIPLSFGQERLWVLDRLGAGAAYNMPAVLLVRGPMDVELVERSLNAIVARHESLRTTFEVREGSPSQVVADHVGLRVDVRDVGEPGRAAERIRFIDGFVREEIAQPFDLEKGPLIRAVVARLGPDEHLVVLTLHHIVADAWSMRAFIVEMGLCYRALAHSEPLVLPALTVQYPDYAITQREREVSEAAAADLDFWTGYLKGAPEVLELPLDLDRPSDPRHVGGSVRRTISPELKERLGDLALRHEATVLQVLLAAFAALLHRYSGADELLVGVPMANRDRPELGPLIGFFVNTIPLRFDFREDPPFGDLVDRVRESVVAALAHADTPFERIVESVNPQRRSNRTPLVQVMFGFQEAPTAGAHMEGADLEILPFHNGTSKFDLTVLAEDRPDGIEVVWEYDSEIFLAGSVERLAANFEVMLEDACSDAFRKVSTLALLTPEERETVVSGFNLGSKSRAIPVPSPGTVDAIFRARAGESPETAAVEHPAGTLTYRQLEGEAVRIAELLACQEGVGAIVAVCCDPGPELIASILAVSGAGLCYVPVAASDPEARLAFILEDAGVSTVLTQSRYRSKLAKARPSLNVVAVDGHSDARAADQAGDGLSSGAPVTTEPGSGRPERGGRHRSRDKRHTEDDAVYLMYTSGSTGVPKGVKVPHRAVTRLVFGQEYVAFEAGKRIAQWNNPCFDAFTFEVWGALLHGGTVVCVPNDVLLAPQTLGAVIRSKRIEVAFITSSLFNEVVRTNPTAFATMDTLIVGGEALDARSIGAALSSGPPRRVVNGYGPTECTTFACTHEIRAVSGSESAIPIGRAIHGTAAYVLDRHGVPVPIGVRGELCIGGSGVSLGYHRRPELTAERFVPDPFSPGGTMYRTGDLASWRPDGTLSYHGRIDGQVKVRGHRIETGEVEHAISKCPGVAAAVVTARRLEAGHLQLVAYVVAMAGADVTPESVEVELRSTLPSYMIPARWVIVDDLPLTATGKVDRQSLPDPGEARLRADRSENDEESGRSEMIAVLGEIWEEVLGVRGIRPSDNFFSVGGDSILAIQVVARAQERGLNITAHQLIGSSDLAELALVSTNEALVEAEQGLIEGEAPLTPVQRWFFARASATTRFCQSILLALDADADLSHVEKAVSFLPERHDALRLRFARGDGPFPRQFHGEVEQASSFEVLETCDMVETDRLALLRERGEQVKSSMDIGAGPLLRAVAVTGGDGRPWRMLLVAHHLVVDAVSWRILVEDLVGLCAEIARSGSVSRPRKTSSFASWARALEDSASDPIWIDQVDTWLDVAGGSPDPRGDVPPVGGEVSTTRFEIGRLETTSLFGAAREAYAMSLQEVVLAAVAASPTVAAGAPSVRVDVEGHGRDESWCRVDLSRTVGWFTALYPVRLPADSSAAVRELLVGVKEALRAVPAGGVGWGVLSSYGGPEVNSRLGSVPEAWIRFNYLGRIETAAAGGIVSGTGTEETGDDSCGADGLFYPLEIEAMVVDGCLSMSFTGRGGAFEQTIVEEIAREVQAEFEDFAQHLGALDGVVYSPSDFPEVALSEDELASVVAQLDAAGVDV